MQHPHFSLLLTANQGDLAIIRALGPDAASFLQGQLTQDVLLMDTHQARLAAWCSAKGRMLASFIVWKNSQQEFFLLLSRDLLASTLKRLKMYVLRAKCELSDASEQIQVRGLVGAAMLEAIAAWPETSSNLAAVREGKPWARGQAGHQSVIVLPPGRAGESLSRELARALLIEHEATPQDALPAPSSDQLHAWNALEISSGIARLSAPVSEVFVPQMLNFESVGGVNFKKGCYPGQEVVARSQFRGTLKRRGYIVTCASPLFAGQEVFDGRDPEQPCGTVAQAAPDAEGARWLAMISMQVTASDSPDLRCGSAHGTSLTVLALPYALRDDI